MRNRSDEEDISFNSMLDDHLEKDRKYVLLLLSEIGELDHDMYGGKWNVLINTIKFRGHTIVGIPKATPENIGKHYKICRSGWYRGVFYVKGYNIISNGNKWLLYLNPDDMKRNF